jgi:hypothetical protein
VNAVTIGTITPGCFIALNSLPPARLGQAPAARILDFAFVILEALNINPKSQIQNPKSKIQNPAL